MEEEFFVGLMEGSVAALVKDFRHEFGWPLDLLETRFGEDRLGRGRVPAVR